MLVIRGAYIRGGLYSGGGLMCYLIWLKFTRLYVTVTISVESRLEYWYHIESCIRKDMMILLLSSPT